MCVGSGSVRGASGGDLLKLRRAHEIDASPWGIWTAYGAEHVSVRASEQHSNYSVDPEVFDLIDETGVKHAYVGWDWPAVETQAGRYDFGVYDQILNGLRARRISPLVQIYGSPNKAYGMDTSVQGAVIQRDEYLLPWLKAIEATVERSRGRVELYEIWNEPNAAPWFWTGEADPVSYAKMVKEVSSTIRETDSKAQILAGAVADVPLDYVDAFLSADSGSDWSGFSFHPYSEYPERETLAILEMRNLLTRRLGREVPIFQTECGYPSDPNTAGFRGPGPWSEAIQARWLLRRMLTDLAIGARASVYFLLRDIPGEIEVGPNAGAIGVNAKGLITSDGRRKPAFRALQNLCALIDDRFRPVSIDARISMEVRSGSEGAGTAEVRSLALGRDGILTHYLLWDASPLVSEYTGPEIELRLPIASRRRYVCVDLLSGEITSPRTRSSNKSTAVFELSLKDYPIALVESNALPR
jgi:hypothetical protein